MDKLLFNINAGRSSTVAQILQKLSFSLQLSFCSAVGKAAESHVAAHLSCSHFHS